MTTRITLADQALMEKLASLEPEDAEATPGEQVKIASERPQRGHSARALIKAAEVIEMGKRIGRLRAEAEIAALYGR